MEIVKKWDHKVEEGIYRVSKPVKNWAQIKHVAENMVSFFDESEGNFHLDYKSGYALSHCQMDVGKYPFAFFVLNDQFIKGHSERTNRDTNKNFYFPSRVIINAKILETPEKLDVTKPVRKLHRENGKLIPRIELTETQEKNLIGVPEACFSFTNRTPKTMERYFRIKVRYQYPRKVLGITVLITKTEWCEGLKAHILQHEIDHANAINMYYDKH